MTDVPALFDLTGRTALITGGSRGLGREMALAFAAAGADVMIASRSLESCEETAREVEAVTGRRAIPYACHIGRWNELDGLADAAWSQLGGVDILVNNAGKSPLYDSVVNVNEQLWDSVLGLNLKGPFRLSALLGTRMIERAKETGRSGSIINISSIAAIHPTPDVIPYTAAKAGLNAITIGFAQTFGPHVRVNCIMPGSFRTDISKAWDWKMVDQQMKRVALRRVGEPHEIVGAALFLASDAGSYTTGAVFTVDGGVPT
ncbi:MAG: short-chain dehydrogenase [Acidimicrobiales bacterium mtb01]|nr:SDR family oxidoreductase [Actinomycetota bacterium]TEX47890.1 MAG: short-chain dehydrogenase [Acidimicrobiales bacterium mtb01]